MFIIKRTDQGGGYVAPSGHPSSYVRRPEDARRFDSIEAAGRELCPENERVLEYFPPSGPFVTQR